MLQCLDRDARLVFVLGDVLALSGHEAADVLGVSHDVSRKRLSRVRSQIQHAVSHHCGLINPEAPCRCSRRVDVAVRSGRVQPEQLRFVDHDAVERTKQQIQRLYDVAALFRSVGQFDSPAELTAKATWRSELSGHAILPSERPTQVADILSDIPLPTDFDTAHLTDSGIAKVRYQLVAEVTSAVWCAWVQKWDAALTAGDTAVAADAAAAIASSKTWHSLTEIANQGGWSEVMWRNAQRVADGDRTVAAEAASGEGCDQA